MDSLWSIRQDDRSRRGGISSSDRSASSSSSRSSDRTYDRYDDRGSRRGGSSGGSGGRRGDDAYNPGPSSWDGGYDRGYPVGPPSGGGYGSYPNSAVPPRSYEYDMGPSHGPPPSYTSGGQISGSRYPSDFLGVPPNVHSGPGDSVIRMRGLPYSARESNIREFFEGIVLGMFEVVLMHIRIISL